MAAPESTKLQVNFKLADGTLVNLYATSSAELTAQLESVQDIAAGITAAASALGVSSNTSYATKALGATVVDSGAPVPEGHCKHGQLTYRESKPGAEKQWKGWFCPSPQGTPDQCSPKFIR